MKTEETSKSIRTAVQKIAIDDDIAGQRIDNFLRNVLSGVPKSRVYRLLRRGEVRVNGGRVKAEYKLLAGDEVRVPPDSTLRTTLRLSSVALSRDFEVFSDLPSVLLSLRASFGLRPESSPDAFFLRCCCFLRSGLFPAEDFLASGRRRPR